MAVRNRSVGGEFSLVFLRCLRFRCPRFGSLAGNRARGE